MKAIVLGAAAGGGFPQWNCACRHCCMARAGDPKARHATQASVAISGNGIDWIVVGASPDIRQQILHTPQLWPKEGSRHSPIVAVVLVGGDVDAMAGLLVLREQHSFTIYADQTMLDLLDKNCMFDVLDRDVVQRHALIPLESVSCTNNVTLSLIPMPGKVPLYLEKNAGGRSGLTYAALLASGSSSIIVAPACAEITETVKMHLGQADILFFDGTFFTDDEMITSKLGTKTARRMGHVPISGYGGTLEGLADISSRRILLHINNSNPILLADSPERQQVEAAGFEIAYDGMEVQP